MSLTIVIKRCKIDKLMTSFAVSAHFAIRTFKRQRGNIMSALLRSRRALARAMGSDKIARALMLAVVLTCLFVSVGIFFDHTTALAITLMAGLAPVLVRFIGSNSSFNPAELPSDEELRRRNKQ